MNKKTLFFASMLFFMLLIVFFMKSPFFNVQTIIVDADSAEMRSLAEKTFESLKGKNMWDLELDDITSAINAKTRSVQSVYFQRHWPSTLRLIVEERKGIAQTFVDHDIWVVDQEGVSFRKKTEALPLFWPLPVDQKNYHEVLSWLAKDHPNGVNGLTWDRELGLVVHHVSRVKIILGREKYTENWKKAEEAILYLKSKSIASKTIDATYNNRAVVSL